MTAREIAEGNLILLATVGSNAHGLALPGNDDTDYMGVCIEPPEYVIGLKHFEQDVYRTQPEGYRSGPGDVDRTIYSARKFCRLALSGNPSILTLLFAKPESPVIEMGVSLQNLAPSFAARSAGKAFLGYMVQQRQRLTGERGQMNVKRPELVEKYGYDTKYAMHMIRLGYQGIEYLETGALTLPMREPDRDYVYSVREGKVGLNEVLTRAGQLERALEDLLDTSPLPPKPDSEAVNSWLVSAYEQYWAGF